MLMPVVDAELQLHTNLRLRNVHKQTQTQTQTQENTLLRCNQHQPKKWTKNNNAKNEKVESKHDMDEASQEKNTYTYQ